MDANRPSGAGWGIRPHSKRTGWAAYVLGACRAMSFNQAPSVGAAAIPGTPGEYSPCKSDPSLWAKARDAGERTPSSTWLAETA